MSEFLPQTGYLAALDQTKLFYRLHRQKSIAPAILFIHGHGEHSGRYVRLFDFLFKSGFHVLAYDARGNGQSEGRRVYIRDLRDYTNDVTAAVNFIKREFANESLKPIVMGHSLGGLVALQWSLLHPSQLRALVLSSPCLGVAIPGFLKHLNQWIYSWNPKWLYSNPVYPPHLTHDQAEIARYKKDPLIQRKITSGLLHAMLDEAKKLETIPLTRLPFALALFRAGNEKIVSLQAMNHVWNQLESPQKQVFSYPEFFHEIFLEENRDAAYQDLLGFLTSLHIEED